MHQKVGINGFHIILRQAQSTVVIRRNIHRRLDRYDVHRWRDQIDALAFLLEVLAKEVPGFTQRLIAADKERCYLPRRNRYVATEQAELYRPARKDLADTHARKVEDFWLAENLNLKQKRTLVAEAQEASRLERLPETNKW